MNPRNSDRLLEAIENHLGAYAVAMLTNNTRTQARIRGSNGKYYIVGQEEIYHLSMIGKQVGPQEWVFGRGGYSIHDYRVDNHNYEQLIQNQRSMSQSSMMYGTTTYSNQLEIVTKKMLDEMVGTMTNGLPTKPRSKSSKYHDLYWHRYKQTGVKPY